MTATGRPRSTDFSKLPPCVGIFADSNYEQRAWIHNLILEVQPNTVIVTVETPMIDEFIRKIAVLRENVFFKMFELDPWELRYASAAKAERARDFLFVSYIRFMRGRLFFFPVRYETSRYNMKFSKRMQSVILTAQELKVPYEIIWVDEDGNDISTSG